METLQNIFQAEIIQRLGWTLVHFVWQGAAICLILAIVLKLLHKSSANVRYIIACMALALIVLMPVVTIRMVDVSAETIEPITEATVDLPKVGANTQAIVEMPQLESTSAQVAIAPRISLKDKFVETVEPALPYVVIGWLVGVFGLSLWHLGGWRQLQRLRYRMVKQVTPALKAKLQQLSNALGIQKTISLVESALVQVPTVVGWLKPVILLPVSALSGLSSEQIEAILAHELAHIKRYDYLINILQTVVEILGFYHPAVWWVSRKIRVERENCCDDLAVSFSSDRVCYARALTSMEEIRSDRLAVAASGGSLFSRICRLLGKDNSNNEKSGWLPSVIAILLILGLIIPTTLALSKQEKTLTTETTKSAEIEKVIGNASLDVKVSLTVRGEKVPADCRVRILNRNNEEIKQIEKSENNVYRFSDLEGGEYTIEAYFWDSYPTAYEKVTLSDGEHKEITINSQTDQIARIPISGKIFDKRYGWVMSNIRIHFTGAPQVDAIADTHGFFSTTADRARFHQCMLYKTTNNKLIAQVKINNSIDEQLAQNLSFHIDPDKTGQILTDPENDGIFCDNVNCKICNPPFQHATLEFRIAPDSLVSSRAPALHTEDEMQYIQQLREKGPDFNRRNNDEYIWLPIDNYEPTRFGFLAVQKYDNKTYLLVANKPELCLRYGNMWSIVKAYASQDRNGNPAVTVEVDQFAGKVLQRITSKNIGASLAIIVNGEVISAPHIMSTISNKIMIVGSFTQQQAEQLAKSLSPKQPAEQVEWQTGPNGLVGYWNFNGNARDSAGGNHGVVSGANLTEGLLGQAYYFDGDNDFIKLPEFELSNFTLSVLVKTFKSEPSVNNRRIFLLDSGADYYAVQGNSAGGIGVYLTDRIEINEYDWRFEQGKWTHVAVTYDGSHLKIYIDARMVESAVAILKEAIKGYGYIGGTKAHRGEFWCGVIDEVKLYNRALTDEQIRYLCHKDYVTASGRLRPYRSSMLPVEVVDGLVVREQLNQVVDLSALTPEMSFVDALEELKSSVRPPLNIIVLWRDLYENAEINKTTPINIDGMSAIKLSTALKLLLRSVSGYFADEVGYAVEDGIITIATRNKLPKRLKTRLYDSSVLLGRPADYRAR